MTKKPLQESLQQAVQKAWADAVSKLQTVQEDVTRRFHEVVEKAPLLPANTDEVQRLLGDLGRRLQQNSEAVGQRIEESVRSVYSRVREPLLVELSTMKTRAEQLGQRIESQLRRRDEPAKPSGGEPAGGQRA